MSASTMAGSAHAPRAAAARPSKYSGCSGEEERLLHRAPFLRPFELLAGGDGSDLGDHEYGTVSQSVLVQCKSERCLLYAYRTTIMSSGTGRKRTRGDTSRAPEVEGKWTWRRVDL